MILPLLTALSLDRALAAMACSPSRPPKDKK